MAIEIVPTGSREGGGGMDIETRMSATPQQDMQPMDMMQNAEMPRFDTLSADRQMELLNLFPDMERNQIMALMETGLTFEDALDEVGRMFQNPPPELRQDEMDMMNRLRNLGMDIARGNTSGSTSDAEFRAYQDAVNMMKGPQTGMPLNNMSGALGALGDAMPMRGRGTTATDNIQADMMNRKDNM